MAIWQVTIVFIPAQWADDNKFQTNSLYCDDGFDTTIVWPENTTIEDFEITFNSILPKAKSWDNEIDIWGNTDTNDLTIIREGHQIECVMCRLDLRDNVFALINSIINSAILLNCVLFIPSHKVIIKPNLLELKQYLLQSKASKYLKNPENFLNELTSE